MIKLVRDNIDLMSEQLQICHEKDKLIMNKSKVNIIFTETSNWFLL